MNYVNTFIAVAADSKAQAGTVPPAREGKKTIAQLEYELIAAQPYQLTQEEVQFSVHVQRVGLSAHEVKAKRSALWRSSFPNPWPACAHPPCQSLMAGACTSMSKGRWRLLGSKRRNTNA